MLKTLQSLLFPDQPATAEGTITSRVDAAVAVLLMEVARADFDVAEEELDVIRGILIEDFAMSSGEANDLVHHATIEADNSTSFFPFVQVLNEQLDRDQKRQVVETLWRVAYADADKHRLEEAIVRRIADLLYVPHSEFIRTRVRVENDDLPD